MVQRSRFKATDVAFATLKATVSTIPVVGPYLSELAGLPAEAAERARFEARLTYVEKLHEDGGRRNDFTGLVYSTSLEAILETLDSYYFDCGASNLSAIEVFVSSWYSGADHGYAALNARDKFTFLAHILAKCNSAYEETQRSDFELPQAINEKVVRIAAQELSTVSTDYLNDDLIALTFLLFALRLIGHHDLESASAAIVKSLEHMALGQLKTINIPAYRYIDWTENGETTQRRVEIAHTFEMRHLFLLLSQVYAGAGQFALAKRTVEILFNLVRSVPPHEYYWSFKAAEVLITIGASSEATSTLNQFLRSTRELALTDPHYKDNADLWSKREYAAYYITENSSPPLPRFAPCLCVSGLPYAECCADLLAKSAT